jgi:methyl-accepting chemotaxis protein
VLIRDSVDRVNAGTGLVDQAGATMLDVVSSVSNLATVIHEIANANREQTSGIEQINRAIMQWIR